MTTLNKLKGDKITKILADLASASIFSIEELIELYAKDYIFKKVVNSLYYGLEEKYIIMNLLRTIIELENKIKTLNNGN